MSKPHTPKISYLHSPYPRHRTLCLPQSTEALADGQTDGSLPYHDEETAKEDQEHKYHEGNEVMPTN